MRILKDDLVEKKQRKIILMQKEINELERHKVLLKAQSDGYAPELLSLQKQCIRHKKEKAEIFERILKLCEPTVPMSLKYEDLMALKKEYGL